MPMLLVAIAPHLSLDRRASKPQHQLDASPLPVSVRWAVAFFTFVVHIAVIVATTSFGRLHHFIRISPQRSTYFQFVGSGMLGYFPVVEIVCYTATTCHGIALLHAASTIWQHTQRHRKVSASIRSLIHDTTIRVVHRQSWWRRVYSQVDGFYAKYRTEVAQARLLIEVGLQTFQANKMSGLVSSVWINRLLVVVIIVNCWFTPIIYSTMRHKTELTKRIVRLTIDTMLDVVYCLGIPAVILYPYWCDYDPTVDAFPIYFYVRDAWGLVLLAEFRQIFISSTADFVSKTCPWFFMCYRLHSLRQIVASKQSVAPEITSTTTRMFRVLNLTHIVCGFTVLVLHLQTAWIATTTSVQGCLVEMRPWFTSSHTCTVLELSCSQRHITGTRDEIAAVLSEFTPHRIQGFIISHCPRVEMPSTILSLEELGMMKIYNSTVVEWTQDTAITTAQHANFQKFIAIETNFSSFPEGLLSPEMPATFNDVKFVGSNLTGLPVSAAKAWRGVKYATFELNYGIVEFPSTLALIPELIMVFMPSNTFRFIPDDHLEDMNIWILHLANNPLSALPERLGRPGSMIRLNIQWTNISSLPAGWMSTRHDVSHGSLTIDAAFTPLCEDPQARESADRCDDSGYSLGRFSIRCIDASAFLPKVSYPLDLERSWREVNRYPST